MGQSFQAQIQQLFQAGVATHVVENPASIDPLFALSKVRDFPEVTFAASFPDGTVVLGCPTDLPEPLVSIAHEVTQLEPPPDPIDAKMDAILAGLDKLEAPNQGYVEINNRLDQVWAALEQQQSAAPALQGMISQLNTAIEQGFQKVSNGLEDDATVRALEPQLLHIARTVEAASDMTQISQQLSELSAQTSETLSALQTQETAPDMQALEKHMMGFETRLMAQIAEISAAPDPSQQTEAITANHHVIEQALSMLSNDIKALITMHGTAMPNAGSSVQMSEMIEAFEDLPLLATIDQKLTAISQSVTSFDGPENGADYVARDQLTAQIDTLVADVAAMAHQPPPAIDLTEQRQGFARFQTAMGTVLSRLEQAITQLSETNQPSSNPIHDHLNDQLSALSDQISLVSSVPNQLNQIEAGLAELPRHRDAILNQLEGIAPPPTPIHDQTAQRRSMAYFANAIGMVASRVETAVDSLSQQGHHEEVTALLNRIETALTDPAPQQPNTDIIDTLTAQNREMSDLRTELARVFERPPPTLDLTAQRKSFAQFGTALATVIARFERVAAQIEGKSDEKVSESTSQTPEAPNASFSDNRISLDKLRYDFAELIASQIKGNSATSVQSDQGA